MNSREHCRMTNCAVISTQQADVSQESRWVSLYGADNRVDHCTISGEDGQRHHLRGLAGRRH